MPTIIPFRPFQSVARQLHRFGGDHQRPAYFRQVHQQLAAGGDGKRVASDVSAAHHQAGHDPQGDAA